MSLQFLTAEKLRKIMEIGEKIEEEENKLIVKHNFYYNFHSRVGNYWIKNPHIEVSKKLDQEYLEKFFDDMALLEFKFVLVVCCVNENCYNKFYVPSNRVIEWNFNRFCKNCREK